MLEDFDAELTCALREVELPEGWSLLQQEGEELQRERRRETVRDRERQMGYMYDCLFKERSSTCSLRKGKIILYLFMKPN